MSPSSYAVVNPYRTRVVPLLIVVQLILNEVGWRLLSTGADANIGPDEMISANERGINWYPPMNGDALLNWLSPPITSNDPWGAGVFANFTLLSTRTSSVSVSCNL